MMTEKRDNPATGEIASEPPSGAASESPEIGPPSPSLGLHLGKTHAAGGARPSYLFLIVVTVINLVADLASKGWAKNHFETSPVGEREVVIIPDFLNVIYAQNRGGAWGFLQNETESLRRPFFLVVSVAAIVFIVTLYRKLEKNQWVLKWGLPMVLGGALGNFVDRVRYGFVVDFIDVWAQVKSGDFLSTFTSPGVHHWPTFNIADVSICIGVALMAIDMFMPQGQGAQSKKPKAQDASSAGDEPRSGAEGETATPEAAEDLGLGSSDLGSSDLGSSDVPTGGEVALPTEEG